MLFPLFAFGQETQTARLSLHFINNIDSEASVQQRKNLISGHHYLMSDEMLKEAYELFEIDGFPSYSLVDKEGNIVDNEPGKYASRELFEK